MKNNVIFTVLILALFGVLVLSLMTGTTRIGAKAALGAVLRPSEESISTTIIIGIRLPRIILALLVGAGLAACGCVFQGILRNPLAEPYTLGISGGAALGVTAGTVLGAGSIFGYYGHTVLAFLGAMLSVTAVYLAANRKYFSATTLILAGVTLSFVLSSCVLLIFSLSRASQVHNTLLWLMGDLSSAEPALIRTVALFITAGTAALLFFSRDIDLLSLGEERAAHLGLKTESARKLLFVITSLVTASCVCASGIIGFVGLLVPHFMRQFTGPRHTVLIPASMLAGAVFLAAADTLARTIIAPVELPVGVITGIFGGTFLLVYLLGKKKWEIF